MSVRFALASCALVIGCTSAATACAQVAAPSGVVHREESLGVRMIAADSSVRRHRSAGVRAARGAVIGTATGAVAGASILGLAAIADPHALNETMLDARPMTLLLFLGAPALVGLVVGTTVGLLTGR